MGDSMASSSSQSTGTIPIDVAEETRDLPEETKELVVEKAKTDYRENPVIRASYESFRTHCEYARARVQRETELKKLERDHKLEILKGSKHGSTRKRKPEEDIEPFEIQKEYMKACDKLEEDCERDIGEWGKNLTATVEREHLRQSFQPSSPEQAVRRDTRTPATPSAGLQQMQQSTLDPRRLLQLPELQAMQPSSPSSEFGPRTPNPSLLQSSLVSQLLKPHDMMSMSCEVEECRCFALPGSRQCQDHSDLWDSMTEFLNGII